MEKIHIRDKRSGSNFRESLVRGFKNTSILCQFNVADPNGIRCIFDPGDLGWKNPGLILIHQLFRYPFRLAS
jgi:hypothetical protein